MTAPIIKKTPRVNFSFFLSVIQFLSCSWRTKLPQSNTVPTATAFISCTILPRSSSASFTQSGTLRTCRTSFCNGAQTFRQQRQRGNPNSLAEKKRNTNRFCAVAVCEGDGARVHLVREGWLRLQLSGRFLVRYALRRDYFHQCPETKMVPERRWHVANNGIAQLVTCMVIEPRVLHSRMYRSRETSLVVTICRHLNGH